MKVTVTFEVQEVLPAEGLRPIEGQTVEELLLTTLMWQLSLATLEVNHPYEIDQVLGHVTLGESMDVKVEL